MNEVHFEVDVSKVEGHLGVTLFVFDGQDPPDDHDDVDCYFLVFEGQGDPDEVAIHFSHCHEEAMTTVNLQGEVTEEEFVERLENSIELAGELMIRHGLRSLESNEISEGMMVELFHDDISVKELDRKMLN